MPYVPQSVIAALEENSSLTGMDLFLKGLAGSPRTGNRWKQYVSLGVAESAKCTLKPPVVQDDVSLDELINLSTQLVEVKQKINPVITTQDFVFEKGPIAIIFASCMHLGGRYTAYAEFKSLFDKTLNIPNLYWGLMGDDIESFLPQFPNKSAVVEQVWQIDVQLRMIEKVLNELADRDQLLLGMSGQHGGDWLFKEWGINPVKEMYIRRGRPFFDGQAYIKLKVEGECYNVAMSHKFRGHSQMNPLHAQATAMRFSFPMADCIIQGDKHSFAWAELPAYGFEAEVGNRANDRVLLLQSGTGKTGPDPYTIKGWSKGRLGWPVVLFMPDEHLMKWTWDIKDAVHWLGEKQ